MAKKQAGTKTLYRVYFFRPANGKVAEAAETQAVSEEEAVSHVRWNTFGRLTLETVFQKHGFRLIAARVGTKRDQKLRFLATGQQSQPERSMTRSSRCGRQLYFVGQGFSVSEPDQPHR